MFGQKNMATLPPSKKAANEFLGPIRKKRDRSQIFFGTTYQNPKKLPNSLKNTKWPQNIPNSRKICQI
jgi:hypothetical protein